MTGTTMRNESEEKRLLDKYKNDNIDIYRLFRTLIRIRKIKELVDGKKM